MEAQSCKASYRVFPFRDVYITSTPLPPVVPQPVPSVDAARRRLLTLLQPVLPPAFMLTKTMSRSSETSGQDCEIPLTLIDKQFSGIYATSTEVGPMVYYQQCAALTHFKCVHFDSLSDCKTSYSYSMFQTMEPLQPGWLPSQVLVYLAPRRLPCFSFQLSRYFTPCTSLNLTQLLSF